MRKQVQYRLLVVRLGSMGDVLHALPAITALRKAHPAWKIGWAIEPQWRDLLTSESLNLLSSTDRGPARPLVDTIHLVPVKTWGKKPFKQKTLDAIRALRAELRGCEYDAVLDLQGSIRSAIVARLSGCRRIVGEAAPRESLARWLFTERVKTTREHIIEQDFELASAVAGDLLEPIAPWLPTDPEAELWCDNLLDFLGANRSSKPVVLVHPGGGWGAKRWPAERYGAVVEEFAQRRALVLVNAGPGEDALAASVVNAAGGLGSIIVSTLAQLIALTRRVSLVIGGDTGPIHLACAVGKPVVGIYGPTDPRRNGPYGSRFQVLRNPDSRSDHARREQPEAGLLTISPEAVMAAALEMLVMAREREFAPEWGGDAGWDRG